MWFWLHDPIGTVWECTFALASILQFALIMYHNRPAEFSEDERALQAQLTPEIQPRHFRALLRVGSWESAEHGTELTRQGEFSNRLIFLRSGSATVLVNGHRIGTCSAGSLIGEIGFTKAEPATATVVADGNICYFAMDARDLRRLMRSDPEIADLINRCVRTSVEKKLVEMNETKSRSLPLSPEADQTVVRFPAAQAWSEPRYDAARVA